MEVQMICHFSPKIQCSLERLNSKSHMVFRIFVSFTWFTISSLCKDEQNMHKQASSSSFETFLICQEISLIQILSRRVQRTSWLANHDNIMRFR